MFCPKCGKELKPGTKFCNGCGAPLETGTGGGGKDAKPKKRKGPLTVLLLILAVALLLGGGAVAAYKLDLFGSFWDPGKKEADAGREKRDKEDEDDRKSGEEEEEEEEEDEDSGKDGKGKAGKEEADEEERPGNGGDGEDSESGAGQAEPGKHTRIADMPDETEPAATEAAFGYQGQAGSPGYPAQAGGAGYPAQTAASGFPAETGGAAQAYSDFTAPGVGNGAVPEPTAGAAGSDGTYMIPDSSSRRLSMSDLAGLSKDQLKIARNEIYARHGRLFDSETLQFYFNSKSWYHGTIAPSAFSEDLLSQVEKDNVKLIKQKEASMP
ncbi:MAG: YARHG domain-containing protein [Lachnospiraceae bacterium]|nr:YARHG domain-containing protein [Lachnospiraceae bacterium]